MSQWIFALFHTDTNVAPSRLHKFRIAKIAILMKLDWYATSLLVPSNSHDIVRYDKSHAAKSCATTLTIAMIMKDLCVSSLLVRRGLNK